MKKNNSGDITAKPQKRKRRFVILVILIALGIYVIVGFCNTGLETTHYVYRSSKLPKEFDGYKIVLISDLHHKNFGHNQSELIRKIKAAKPDMIVLTGDIVDENHTDMTSIENFIMGISRIAPAYYVNGNHELDKDAGYQYERLKALLQEYGITNLNNDTYEVKKKQESITLTGVSYCGENIVNKLTYADESKFNILLYHCSDAFGKISSYGYDIILSGHAHGGIIRLPFVGGILGNNRDFFPKYAGGVYIENQCTLFSSRGLGDAEVPRFYNPPEVVVITLKSS